MLGFNPIKVFIYIGSINTNQNPARGEFVDDQVINHSPVFTTKWGVDSFPSHGPLNIIGDNIISKSFSIVSLYEKFSHVTYIKDSGILSHGQNFIFYRCI